MEAQYVAYTPPEGVLSLDDLRAQGALFIVVGDVGDTYRCIADLSAIIG
jgi:hypothetical protein